MNYDNILGDMESKEKNNASKYSSAGSAATVR